MNRTARAVVAESAVGQGVERAFPAASPETLRELGALLDRARSAGAVQARIAEPLPLGGPGTHFAVFAVPLRQAIPSLRKLVVFQDVTEVRALAHQLVRAEKLATVGVLAAGFAHEVGTPLGVMRGRAELLVSRLPPGGAESENVRIILEEVDRVSRTIRDLLDFSRAGRVPATGAVPLGVVAAEVMDLLAIEASRRGVGLEVSVPGAVPDLAADPDQLKQVLVNLAMNGLDACARGGRVRVRGRAERGARVAVIEVEDDGAGIAPEHRHRVFDPFFTTKKRGQGTGLGLAVVARIAQSHGAEIEVEEAAPRGTRFVLRWPLAEVAGARAGGNA
jgi:signal transduction histidine kinase